MPMRRAVFWAFVHLGRLRRRSAAILYTGRLETGTPVLGQRILLDIVGAAVIGGVSLFGGKGKIVWTVLAPCSSGRRTRPEAHGAGPLLACSRSRAAVILFAAAIDAAQRSGSFGRGLSPAPLLASKG